MSTSPAISSEQLARTRRRVRSLAAEIASLSRSQVPTNQFHSEFLRRVLAAVGAMSGTLWHCRAERDWHAAAQLPSPDPTEITKKAPPQWLAEVLTANQPRVIRVKPEAAVAGTQPTLILAIPLQSEQCPWGVLELRQRASIAPAALPGQLQFLQEMAKWFARHDSRSAAAGPADERLATPSDWREFLEFTQEIHGPGTTREAVSNLADAARRWLSADRASVVLLTKHRATLIGLSGLAKIDRRSPVVQSLEAWASEIRSAEGPIYWDQGPHADVKTGTAFAVHRSVAQPTAVVALPLRSAAPPGTAPGPAPLLGWLIAEWFQLAELPATVPRRASAAQAQAELVLHRLPGNASSLARGTVRGLFKLACVLLVLCGLAAVLTCVETEFTLSARGILQPRSRRDVFAQVDGEVREVRIAHAQAVAAGDVLLVLQNEELERRLNEVAGQRLQLEATIASLQAERVGTNRPPADQRVRLATQLKSCQESLIHIAEEEKLLEKQRQLLQVVSPMKGQVTTWNVAEQLLTRPVQRGQLLLSLADPDGPWELEIDLDEDRLGHLLAARQDLGAALPISFVLATSPEKSFAAQLTQVGQRVELRDQPRPTVPLVADFKVHDVPAALLRPGATARVQIECGKRPLGFVLFHDLGEWFWREIVFRFSWN